MSRIAFWLLPAVVVAGYWLALGAWLYGPSVTGWLLREGHRFAGEIGGR